MKKVIVSTSAATLVGIVVIVILSLSAREKPNYHYNNFNRNFTFESIQLLKKANLDSNSYYFAGIDSMHIYLANSRIPSHLLVINNDLTDTLNTWITGGDSLRFRSPKVMIEAPYFYLADGTQPFIFRGIIGDWKAKPYITDSHFRSAIPLSDKSVVFVRRKDGVNFLQKRIPFNPTPEVQSEPFEKTAENVFNTEGALHLDKETSLLTYVCYFRNHYVGLDTNLNVLYHARTIDSISRARIKSGEITLNNFGTISLSNPPLMVNKTSTVCGHYLYINSNILAKNEDPKTFEEASVIDVYNLEKKSYAFSFYIPSYNGKKLTQFKVTNNRRLIALYEGHIASYQLGTASDEN